ncbi:hypothetical protein QLX08_006238 [Tetragonisca angustula]|uniref:Uncharacterized protein n=1 Tax=Tetragonisca angustula TaxID=166442 RepID=A0AAW0ZUF6_9HYME
MTKKRRVSDGNEKFGHPTPLCLPEELPSTSSPLEDAGSAMRLDATCRVANFEECTSGSFNSGRCAGEPSSCTVKAWVVSGYDVVGNARRRGIPPRHPGHMETWTE